MFLPNFVCAGAIIGIVIAQTVRCCRSRKAQKADMDADYTLKAESFKSVAATTLWLWTWLPLFIASGKSEKETGVSEERMGKLRVWQVGWVLVNL
jgi:hypothetical protein